MISPALTSTATINVQTSKLSTTLQSTLSASTLSKTMPASSTRSPANTVATGISMTSSVQLPSGTGTGSPTTTRPGTAVSSNGSSTVSKGKSINAWSSSAVSSNGSSTVSKGIPTTTPPGTAVSSNGSSTISKGIPTTTQPGTVVSSNGSSNISKGIPTTTPPGTVVSSNGSSNISKGIPTTTPPGTVVSSNGSSTTSKGSPTTTPPGTVVSSNGSSTISKGSPTTTPPGTVVSSNGSSTVSKGSPTTTPPGTVVSSNGSSTVIKGIQTTTPPGTVVSSNGSSTVSKGSPTTTPPGTVVSSNGSSTVSKGRPTTTQSGIAVSQNGSSTISKGSQTITQSGTVVSSNGSSTASKGTSTTTQNTTNTNGSPGYLNTTMSGSSSVTVAMKPGNNKSTSLVRKRSTSLHPRTGVSKMTTPFHLSTIKKVAFPTGLSGISLRPKGAFSSGKQCTEPSTIVGGVLLSSGPYFASVSSAVYSCLAGYTMNGPVRILCSVSATWDTNPPRCASVDYKPKVDNHISLEDSARVPLWLTVILCVTFGLLCLLLLACLLVYCLKILGCWKGSVLGPKIGTTGGVFESGVDGHIRMIMVDDLGPKEAHTKHNPKYAHYDEDHEGFRSNRDRARDQVHNTTSRIPVKAPGHPVRTYGSYAPQDKYHTQNRNSYRKRALGADMFYRREMQEERPDSPVTTMYRREAKMPANQTWMPHSHSRRNNNTSTK